MSEFETLRKELAEYDALRDTVIKTARDIVKNSKHAIYSLHRNEVKKAKEQLKEAEKITKELAPVIKKHPSLRHGMFSSGMEEYAEARAFLQFLENGTLVSCKELGVTVDEYLLGLCDVTGELMRFAVHKGTERDTKAVQAARDLVDMIFGELMQFDFRNSELRRKYDSVKYNLQKIEKVLYDLALQ
ncbi:MAG: hypothetical protein OXR66_05440 [Candidatus Woesearchaeota archaeon]|nr:hypothetical protein [Candidatus Woesearchaeota archaeon]